MRTFREYGPACCPHGHVADAFWRIAKARTEKPVEVRNIGKADLDYFAQPSTLAPEVESTGIQRDPLTVDSQYGT
jgi:hypothetical protein